VVNLPVQILGRTTSHPFWVIQGLNEDVILGADFINKHLLVYDPKFKQVKWRNNKQWAISSINMMHEVIIPKYSSKLVKVKMENGTEDTNQVVAEISCKEQPYLVGGPGLIKIDSTGCSLVKTFNAGPEPIALNRGQPMGQADNVDGQTLSPFDADLVNAFAEKQIMSTRNAGKNEQGGQFDKLIKLEVPAEYEKQYRALLSKHRKIFSVEKSDLGYCDTVLHKLFMKTKEPVYVKQFKIREAHQSYLQDQV
jgi:hypothetical protein